LPLAVVKGDAATAAGAQPSNAVPSFATVGTGVEAFHLATALAFLSNDSRHVLPKNVVNINPPF
jgi:hypothetical protein